MPKMNKSLLAIIGALLGLSIIGLAIFANQLGIDHDISWGKGRFALLLTGIFILVVARFPAFILFTKQNMENRFGEEIWNNLTGSALIMSVAIVYIWFISVGLWTKWPMASHSYYYDSLATSFQQGQLSLPLDPDQALLALSNPYDVPSRSGINWLMDATLFNGKYYLYFGPIPAIIIIVIKTLIPQKIGDPILVFSFSLGVFLFQALLIKKIKKDFFPEIPTWVSYLGILTIGLANPFIILLLSPSIHAAAISGGQFFLMSGLYFAFLALDKKHPSIPFFILTGFLWSCAVGSRAMLAIPVIVLTFFLIVRIISNNFQIRTLEKKLISLLALIIPLVLGAFGLGWYNWVRFGSFTDFGFLYQLTKHNLFSIQNDLFSPAYILQNLYTYFLNPYVVVPRFPILLISRGKLESIVSFIKYPIAYYPDDIAGLLYSMPYILLALINLVKREKPWITLPIFLAFLAIFLPLLMFFWIAFRYMADFFPMLSLLAVIGLLQGYKLLRQNRLLLYPYMLIAILLSLFSIIVTDLLSISYAHGRFKIYNPELLNWMRHLLYFMD